MLVTRFSMWCNSGETSPVMVVVGGWQLCPFWSMAPLRTKAPLCQKRHDNSIATNLTGAHIFPMSSLTSISLSSKTDAFSCLASGANSQLIHSQYGPEQLGLWLFIFPLKTLSPLSPSSILLKCNGTQNPSLSLSDGAEKNNFKGFVTVYNPWLQEKKTLRGLWWDRPLNQSLPQEDSSHWCQCWLTDFRFSVTVKQS